MILKYNFKFKTNLSIFEWYTSHNTVNINISQIISFYHDGAFELPKLGQY